mgnify:CR=1 FL=1
MKKSIAQLEREFLKANDEDLEALLEIRDLAGWSVPSKDKDPAYLNPFDLAIIMSQAMRKALLKRRKTWLDREIKQCLWLKAQLSPSEEKASQLTQAIIYLKGRKKEKETIQEMADALKTASYQCL